MTRPEAKHAPRSDLDDSTVAQLIECGVTGAIRARPGRVTMGAAGGA
ncbi:hypothetical protein [Sulfitobacter sp. M13]